ncbi:GspE/PulE family protein [Echinimonas agarilytica]|uniref:Flp pilus assembly complex ATPase component TadA n=1 Tax=Echinimonas agarilytica TaxID=1215918 RepID=A0AA41W579_9GAMM|nr:type II/IV secretion system protein [Echinimonas agarilytica]MCM2678583.1 Flp pilus assembly complex ATPase component TadA [Echinimonas agarilytica]
MAKIQLKQRLGDLLVQAGNITEEQLTEALAEQRASGRKLGTTLVDMGLLSEEQLMRFLAQQLNVPFIDLQSLDIQPKTAQLLPEVLARRYRALVFDQVGNKVYLGTADPADLNAIDALEDRLSKYDIEWAVVRESQLFEVFDQLYRRTDEISSYASQLGQEYSENEEFNLADSVTDDSEGEATVARMLQSIFEDAVQVKASDIHIEPDNGLLRIRMRVDGQLQEQIIDQAKIAAALVLRLKLIAGLDISEKRLPQDGRFNMNARGHSIDVRLSTMPIQYGESVVMRLLDQSAGILSMDETGMPAHLMKRFRLQLTRPHGMILVTGPTGSGKTTTLYGALSEMNTAETKIITVEDPVEYRLPRISQVQVNAKIDLTFSNVLRTALRQDPDVLLVGEMRDHETVEIGLRGALTGHLVLSTLHTNDAISSALRLLDMGAPGYLVASSLRAIIAQRLVKRVCNNCTAPYQPTADELSWLQFIADDLDIKQFSFQKGRGCQTCHQTGHRGRVGVFEWLEMNDDMIKALRNDDTHEFSEAAKKSSHYQPLARAAFDYAARGITSVSEVLRLAEYIVESEQGD